LYAIYVHTYVHVSDYNLFFFKERVFCFLNGCVKVAMLEIQQPSELLGLRVLRSILILSSHLPFQVVAFLKFLQPKCCVYRFCLLCFLHAMPISLSLIWSSHS